MQSFSVRLDNMNDITRGTPSPVSRATWGGRNSRIALYTYNDCNAYHSTQETVVNALTISAS